MFVFVMLGKYNKRKAEATVQLRQALEGRLVKSFFDFIRRTEATRGARSRSWTNIEVLDSKTAACLKNSPHHNGNFFAERKEEKWVFGLQKSRQKTLVSQ
jgi:hypothetical protein